VRAQRVQRSAQRLKVVTVLASLSINLIEQPVNGLHLLQRLLEGFHDFAHLTLRLAQQVPGGRGGAAIPCRIAPGRLCAPIRFWCSGFLAAFTRRLCRGAFGSTGQVRSRRMGLVVGFRWSTFRSSSIDRWASAPASSTPAPATATARAGRCRGLGRRL